jgi:hypothetical protein
MIPVPAEYRSLLISRLAEAKFRRNARSDCVRGARRFPGRETGLSKNI